LEPGPSSSPETSSNVTGLALDTKRTEPYGLALTRWWEEYERVLQRNGVSAPNGLAERSGLAELDIQGKVRVMDDCLKNLLPSTASLRPQASTQSARGDALGRQVEGRKTVKMWVRVQEGRGKYPFGTRIGTL